jgi:hypothetical protein
MNKPTLVKMVNTPQDRCINNVVQLELRGQNYIIFDKVGVQHPDMLKSFLDENEVSYEMCEPLKGISGQVPAPVGHEYHLRGTGEVRAHHKYQLMIFEGLDFHYNLPINTAQLRLLEKDLPDWNIQTRRSKE